jgi:hypothetical protein
MNTCEKCGQSYNIKHYSVCPCCNDVLKQNNK